MQVHSVILSVLQLASSDLFQFISFDLMPSMFWAHVSPFDTCAFAHEMAGGWPLQTNMPFLRYLPDVSCDPKSMAGNPRHNIHMKRVSTLSVLWLSALLSNPFFFPCQLLDASHNVNVVARYRKRLLQCFGHVQCSMASCFLAQKFCIYIGKDVSAILTQINLGSAF